MTPHDCRWTALVKRAEMRVLTVVNWAVPREVMTCYSLLLLFKGVVAMRNYNDVMHPACGGTKHFF